MVTASLAGKTAVVTGAGSGSAAPSPQRSQQLAPQSLSRPRQHSADATAQAIAGAGGRALALSCDVSRETDTRAAVEAAQSAFGPIHILVNGAATDDPNGTVLDLALADWERVFAVNVTGAYLMSRAVLPGMIAAGGGNIIHMPAPVVSVRLPVRLLRLKGALIQLAKAWLPTTLRRISG
jgi:NAD(P)-dependent dehydrogenase (short-subunit alcohol dehydrogenase family)